MDTPTPRPSVASTPAAEPEEGHEGEEGGGGVEAAVSEEEHSEAETEGGGTGTTGALIAGVLLLAATLGLGIMLRRN